MFARFRNIPAVELLSTSAFRNLFFGNLGNNAGVELRVMAQSWLILELGASQVWVGAAMGLRVVPAIIIGLFAGVMVDRFGGKLVLLWERFFLLLLAILTWVVVVTEIVTLWQIVGLSIISSAVLAMGMPATQTLVRRYISGDFLQAGNSLNTLSFSAARAIGPLMGGALIATYGLSSPFLVLIGLYLLALFFTVRLPKDEIEERPRSSALREIADGFSYMKANPVIFRLVLLSFSVIFNAVFVPIIPIYARERFDAGETGFGLMLAAWAVGQTISALWIATKRDWTRKVPAILTTVALMAIAVPTFAVSSSFPITLLALGLVGAAIPIWTSAVVVLLQTQTEPEMLGRVMSVFSLSLQMMMLGWFIGAWVGEIVGNPQMILTGAAIFTALHIGLIFTSPELRKL